MPHRYSKQLTVEDAAALDKIMSYLGVETLAGKNAMLYFLEQVCLLDRKQQDYGPRNISGFGTFGVIVRMNDKFERLKTLYGKKKKNRPANESIRDTFMDIVNYGVIALMLEDQKWPKD